jgi:hypothetical protein
MGPIGFLKGLGVSRGIVRATGCRTLDYSFRILLSFPHLGSEAALFLHIPSSQVAGHMDAGGSMEAVTSAGLGTMACMALSSLDHILPFDRVALAHAPERAHAAALVRRRPE